MNIKIERWYEGLPFDKLQKKGYVPVGKPALIALMPSVLTDSVLEHAVLDANFDQPNLEVNACALYLKTNIEQGYTHNVLRGMKITDYPRVEGCNNFTIVQPLKRISRQK